MASLYKRNNSKIWWIRFQHQGKRIQKSTGTKDKSEALKLLVQCQEDVRKYNVDATTRHRFEEMSQKFSDEHLPLLKPLTAEGYPVCILAWCSCHARLFRWVNRLKPRMHSRLESWYLNYASSSE